MGVIVWRDDGHGMTVKGNDGGEWSSNNMVVWLGRRQNGDVVEWSGEWLRLRLPFSSSEGWELGGPERVASGGGANASISAQEEKRWD
jgi:hypothetical protein